MHVSLCISPFSKRAASLVRKFIVLLIDLPLRRWLGHIVRVVIMFATKAEYHLLKLCHVWQNVPTCQTISWITMHRSFHKGTVSHTRNVDKANVKPSLTLIVTKPFSLTCSPLLCWSTELALLFLATIIVQINKSPFATSTCVLSLVAVHYLPSPAFLWYSVDLLWETQYPAKSQYSVPTHTDYLKFYHRFSRTSLRKYLKFIYYLGIPARVERTIESHVVCVSAMTTDHPFRSQYTYNERRRSCSAPTLLPSHTL